MPQAPRADLARQKGAYFEPFQQRGDQRARAEGLGLYIVQQIAFAHGGDVSIDSTGATGTTFRVSLPRHAPPP